MEIRCAQCQHVGPAADVVPTAEGAVLVCENCGHRNPLAVSRDSEDEASSGPPRAEPVVGAADVSNESPLLKRGALERLIPEPGAGPRCRKCAHLLDDDESYCPRCGLSVADGHGHGVGEAPWEQPPAGKDAVFEQATLLWKSVEEDPTDESLIKFAEFVKEEALLEYGVRQLRFFLVDYPGHERATGYLDELAASFQSKMIVAQAQAQVRADDFSQTASRVKSVLLWIVFSTWVAIFIFFSSQLMDGCG